MPKKDLRHWLRCALGVLIVGGLMAACQRTKITQPPITPKRDSILYIEFYNRPNPDTAELLVNESVQIAGRVTSRGDTLDSILVRFKVDPESVGVVTPFSLTVPDSPDGFDMQVMFSARKLGETDIIGWVSREGGSQATSDTLHIWVVPSR